MCFEKKKVRERIVTSQRGWCFLAFVRRLFERTSHQPQVPEVFTPSLVTSPQLKEYPFSDTLNSVSLILLLFHTYNLHPVDRPEMTLLDSQNPL